ncbi:hypothetical protein ECDEC12C_0497 [Escherichia coli DEC12C]|nr:hypothetical protein ECDEC12C_0497 [Escherichia coli DEC12C]
MVEGKSSESIDPLSQKRCAFVVSSVQGKIDSVNHLVRTPYALPILFRRGH